jgi:hypothetical protein
VARGQGLLERLPGDRWRLTPGEQPEGGFTEIRDKVASR